MCDGKERVQDTEEVVGEERAKDLQTNRGEEQIDGKRKKTESVFLRGYVSALKRGPYTDMIVWYTYSQY